MDWLDRGMHEATLDFAREVTERRLARQARSDLQTAGEKRSWTEAFRAVRVRLQAVVTRRAALRPGAGGLRYGVTRRT